MSSTPDISEDVLSHMRPRGSLVGTMVGSYRIQRSLGEGSAGVVYLGEHPMVGARVAIKVLHEPFADSPIMVERFINEAKAANLIQSRHIVRVSDFGCLADGSHYAVMEYLEGQTLEHLLHRLGPMTPRQTAELCRQMAIGMSEAHAAGIVHRDLKPANIFVQAGADGTPFVRILDFGIAKLTEAISRGPRGEDTGFTAKSLQKATLAGQVLGTPLYCSPEQAAGESVTMASDIYAVGAMAYELLSGVPPIEGDNLVQIFVRKSTMDARPIQERCPDLPSEMAALIMEMLDRRIDARPPSMADVARRFDAIVQACPRPAASDPIFTGTLASAPSPAFRVPRLVRTSHGGTLTAGMLSPTSSPTPAPVSPLRSRSRSAWWMAAGVGVLCIGVLAFRWSQSATSTIASEPPQGSRDGRSAPAASPSSSFAAAAASPSPSSFPAPMAAAPEIIELDAAVPTVAASSLPVASAKRRTQVHKTPPPVQSARPLPAGSASSQGQLVNPFD